VCVIGRACALSRLLLLRLELQNLYECNLTNYLPLGAWLLYNIVWLSGLQKPVAMSSTRGCESYKVGCEVLTCTWHCNFSKRMIPGKWRDHNFSIVTPTIKQKLQSLHKLFILFYIRVRFPGLIWLNGSGHSREQKLRCKKSSVLNDLLIAAFTKRADCHTNRDVNLRQYLLHTLFWTMMRIEMTFFHPGMSLTFVNATLYVR
jgi:hypothetical protein